MTDDGAKRMANRERQRKWRENQIAQGRKPMTLWLTDDEKFFLERTLLSMRETGGTPAMLRNAKGQLEVIDV